MTTLHIRPYARLLTMLGDQLIKNERVALIELIKNSYDADAEWVQITFEGFGKDWNIKPESKIIIEDDGAGMDENIIRNHLTNPATPEKKRRKAKEPRTPNGRYLQGEKGIGRFAILKLGKKIEITTKKKSESIEHKVDYDFVKFDEEFLRESGQDQDIFLEDLTLTYTTRAPQNFVEKKISIGSRKLTRKTQGTRIEISHLKGTWSENKVGAVFGDVTRLEPLFLFDQGEGDKFHFTKELPFEVFFRRDKEKMLFEDHNAKLTTLIENNTALKYENGFYDQDKSTFTYNKNGQERHIKLNDIKVKGRTDVNEQFGIFDKKKNLVGLRKSECGDFRFGFYVFDFSNRATNSRILEKGDKDIIKAHRIYLYRDIVRVFPYGEPDDDWLKIDMHRGTISAGDYLSNDQLVGYVLISHEHNPDLTDKTNREGLIENGRALDDFKSLLRIFLAFVRQRDYKDYQNRYQDSKKGSAIHNDNVIEKELEGLKEITASKDSFNPALAKKAVSDLIKNYKIERNYLTKRAETTEQLAGVGLSVETTSHDIMSMLEKASNRLDGLIKDCMSGPLEQDAVLDELNSLSGQVSFVSNQLKGIQSLFKSSKQRRKNIPIKEQVDKVEAIYRRLIKSEDISLQVFPTGSPLVASTTDAVLLQVLINLFDNAIYWLKAANIRDRKIEIYLDGDEGTLLFSDNGPGISEEERSYVFEPFYSGKGEDGRGLGMYIASQLLSRQGYEIELVTSKLQRKLCGANFLITFIKNEG